jgi:hypothetical protein
MVIMEPTQEIFDTLKVIIPSSNPLLVRVNIGILPFGIKEIDDVLLRVDSGECFTA